MRNYATRIVWLACCLFFLTHSLQAGQNVVVILDDSGSMNDKMRKQRGTTRIEAAKSALLTVLNTLPEDAQVGIVTLNGGGNWLVPLGPVDRETVQKSILSVRAKGGTPLGRFMKIGTDALLELRNQQHYGNYRLLIVTDGEAGDKRLVNSFLPDILSRGVTVDVIGVDMKSNHSLATKVHSYRRADDPETLTQAVQEVFAETSGDATDAAESDFELLEGIPADFARAALITLSESGDAPIGVIDKRRTAEDEMRQPPTGANASQGGNTGGGSNRSTRPNQPRQRSFGSKIIFVIAFIALLQIIKAVMRGNRRH